MNTETERNLNNYIKMLESRQYLSAGNEMKFIELYKKLNPNGYINTLNKDGFIAETFIDFFLIVVNDYIKKNEEQKNTINNNKGDEQ